jgi:membrane protein DedA with SNARE-associated domain
MLLLFLFTPILAALLGVAAGVIIGYPAGVWMGRMTCRDWRRGRWQDRRDREEIT